MRILVTAGDIDALISQVRLRTPLEALAGETGWPITWRSFHDCARSDLRAAEVLIVQRGASRRALQLQKTMLEQGGIVVYEIDDLLTEVAPHISQHAAVRASLPWLKRCISASDVVTASTARLRDAVAMWTGEAVLVPNYAFDPGEQPLPQADPSQPVHLLVASSDHLIGGALVAALRALPAEEIRIVVVGPPADALAAAGLVIQRHPLLPRAQFLKMARELPNPLALIPLESSRFAACKSAVKWFDYAEAGIPTLASAVPPYSDVMEHDITGALVPHGDEAWQQALSRAIGDAAWRERISLEARRIVRERHRLEHTVLAWRQALAVAAQRRRYRSTPPPSLARDVRRKIGDAWHSLGVALRRINRRRLKRRQESGP